MHRITLSALLAVLLLGACTRMPEASQLQDRGLRETSGLASTLAGAVGFWALNDGGNGAYLYRVSDRGETTQRLRVSGARNRDWEDLASFRWRDENWLLIADIGDNSARRNTVRLLLLREPDANATAATPAATLQVRYPDGPRDAESLAVDPSTGEIIVLSKRDQPNRLYRLSLTAFDTPDIAHQFESIGTVPADTSPSVPALLRQPQLLAIGGFSTALDISADGRHAVVLGYQRARVSKREDGESWRSALQRLQPLPDHGLTQAEAVAFERNGTTLVITSEGENAPLVRQARPRTP